MTKKLEDIDVQDLPDSTELSPADVSRLLSIDPRTAKSRIESGVIPSVVVGHIEKNGKTFPIYRTTAKVLKRYITIGESKKEEEVKPQEIIKRAGKKRLVTNMKGFYKGIRETLEI